MQLWFIWTFLSGANIIWIIFIDLHTYNNNVIVCQILFSNNLKWKYLTCVNKTVYFPKTWGEAIISPLFKKGSPNETKNYRGLSLLSCIGKTLTKILNNRLMAWVESMGILDDGQGAYRCHRSTNDNIFILYAMIQKYLTRKDGRFYCTFVDFSPKPSTQFHIKSYGIDWYLKEYTVEYFFVLCTQNLIHV